MPVDSMSVRFLMGMVQLFTIPVNRSSRSILAISSSWDRRSGHSDGSLRLTMVSTIDMGAGSVALRARPALPHTDSTSGKVMRMLSCFCRRRRCSAIAIPGMEFGMYISEPSSSGGMNSVPSFESGQYEPASTNMAPTSTVARCARTHRSTGR